MKPPSVYIAARGEDQALASFMRNALVTRGVRVRARWIDQDLTNDSADAAIDCAADVHIADVVVVLKPSASFRSTTGGHHVETGLALAWNIPVLVLGHRENVFHFHPMVTVHPYPTTIADEDAVADLVRALAAKGATHASAVR